MVGVNNVLRVVGVMKRPIGGLHDPRIRVGEVPLSLRSDDRVGLQRGTRLGEFHQA